MAVTRKGTTSSAEPSQSDDGWVARPVVAAAVHVAVLLVPAVGAAFLTWVVAGWFPRPSGTAAVGWWAGMLAFGTASYLVIERLSTHLLPLAALLKLSLVFPDQTPSRYRVALRSGTTKSLRDVVERARCGEIGDTPAEAAETVLLLTAALNRHDRITRGHSERVRAYAEVLGTEMGLDDEALGRLRWAALLHDVGKLAVPAEVLNKPGRLTDEEFDIIKTHPLEGAQLVAPLADWLGDEINAVGQHHERFDGGGYPLGLAGHDISLAARIVAVADTFDVITSSRSYKRPVPAAAARAEIARCAGTQFDPAVTKALLSVSLGQLWRAGGPLTWLMSIPGLANAPVIGGAVTTVGGASSAVGVAAVVALGGTSVAVATKEPPVTPLGDPTAVVIDRVEEPQTSDEIPVVTTSQPSTEPPVADPSPDDEAAEVEDDSDGIAEAPGTLRVAADSGHEGSGVTDESSTPKEAAGPPVLRIPPFVGPPTASGPPPGIQPGPPPGIQPGPPPGVQPGPPPGVQPGPTRPSGPPVPDEPNHNESGAPGGHNPPHQPPGGPPNQPQPRGGAGR